MPEKRRVPFHQSDIARAIKGATAGGMKVGRVEIGPDNRIVILAADKAPDPHSAFDAWKARPNAS